MKKILLLLFGFLLFTACKNNKTTNELNVDDPVNNTETEMEDSNNENEGVMSNTEDNSEQVSENGETTTGENPSEGNIPVLGFQGMFQKADDAYSDCDCNCLMIQLNSPERVCLDKANNIYITVTYKKTEENKAAMYYIKGTGSTNASKPIPWDRFDTARPIATVQSLGKQLKVDWVGFTLNGEIASAYDDLGKNIADVYVLK